MYIQDVIAEMRACDLSHARRLSELESLLGILENRLYRLEQLWLLGEVFHVEPEYFVAEGTGPTLRP